MNAPYYIHSVISLFFTRLYYLKETLHLFHLLRSEVPIKGSIPFLMLVWSSKNSLFFYPESKKTNQISNYPLALARYALSKVELFQVGRNKKMNSGFKGSNVIIFLSQSSFKDPTEVEKRLSLTGLIGFQNRPAFKSTRER